MFDDVSNGYHWIDYCGRRVKVDERWHARYAFFNEEKLAGKLKRSLKWCHDQYFTFEEHLLVNAYTVSRIDSKDKLNLDDGFVMLQMIYVHPDHRNTGICSRFLEYSMALAEKEESHLAAVARPFVHKSEAAGEETPSIAQVARDFTKHPSSLVYLPVKTEEGKEAQQKMADLLKSFGWNHVDIRATMDSPDTFGDWAFWTGG